MPRGLLRNGHVQSMLASSKLRKIGAQAVRSKAQEIVIDGGNGVRLLGYHSPQPRGQSRGMIILIHGWEGSSDSAYIISASRFFYARGYAIFRLNLRDHGQSHHLNPGLFHGALIEETFAAVCHLTTRFSDLPSYLIGFSIGGNFALRIAKRSSPEIAPSLKHVFAVSPPLDPLKATLAIDGASALYRRYFVKKWKRSLRTKQRLFPDLYDFGNVLAMDTCMAMTEVIMGRYPEFQDYRDYFSRYTLLGDVFRDLAVPATIIAARDDPVIPACDFETLRGNANLHLLIQSHGGHCGFFESFPLKSWHERKIEEIIASDLQGGV